MRISICTLVLALISVALLAALIFLRIAHPQLVVAERNSFLLCAAWSIFAVFALWHHVGFRYELVAKGLVPITALALAFTTNFALDLQLFEERVISQILYVLAALSIALIAFSWWLIFRNARLNYVCAVFYFGFLVLLGALFLA